MVSNPRAVSIATMIRLRLKRSVITPACKVKISHGKRETTADSAINKGDLVTAEASHGYAIVTIPSPRFEIVVALQSFQYEAPSLVFNLSAYGIPTSRNHFLGLIWSPSSFKVWMYAGG